MHEKMKMSPLIRFVKLDRVSRAEEDLFETSCLLIEKKLQNFVDEELKTDPFLGDAQYQLVWRYV
jgi:hypothetical protein